MTPGFEQTQRLIAAAVERCGEQAAEQFRQGFERELNRRHSRSDEQGGGVGG